MNYQIITDYDSIDKNKWSEFVFSHPNGNIFQTPEMYQVFKSERHYESVVVACTDKEGEISGIIVSVIQKEFKGIFGKLSSRSVIWGGPLIKNNNSEILDKILKVYIEQVRKKAVYTQVRNLWNTDLNKKVFESNGFVYEDHLNILVDLQKSEDVLWKDVYSRRRSQINKSVRQGVKIRIFDASDLVEQSYSILENVYKRAKLPLAGKESFTSANKILGDKGFLKFFGAFLGDNLIGVMYLLCYKERTYEWYIGSYNEFMKIHPNDLIIWEIFKWSKKNGYTIFDFGGAGVPDKEYGVREYKKKFGGETLNLGRYRKIHRKFIMSLSVFGFKLWQLLKFGFRKH